MVAKVTDKGLVLQYAPLPGFRRVIPFDDIERVELLERGEKKELMVHRPGRDALKIGSGPGDAIEEIHSAIERVIDPPLARPGRALPFEELNGVVERLFEKRSGRASVLLAFLLDQALLHRATDVHLVYLRSRHRVRFRVDGILHDVARIPGEIWLRLAAHVKNAAGLASYRRDAPQEGRLTHASNGQKPVEIRLSVMPALGGESVALRLFTTPRNGLDLERLGFSSELLHDYIRTLEKPRGLILLTGPSNSGKSTTIYASVQHLMDGIRSGGCAISLEDPIEFPLDCATQIEVAPQRGLTFDKLLANALRQDIDIIAIGEIRDRETARIALRAALTGHLILSTIHCGHASEAPRRLIDLGLSAAETSEAVSGVLAQRLMRVLCPRCREERSVTDAEREARDVPEWLETVHESRGCTHCMNTGYRGRTAVAELLTITPEIAEATRENASPALIRRAQADAGINDIRTDAFLKASQGITSLKEIRRVLS
ncbi:MAG: type II/IV secretion system protein [Desulfobacterales bacterium]|nr:type II/IV secretion system protein [Desulfobacterales bacterium]